MNMDEKKKIVLEFLEDTASVATPTEIGMIAFGLNYYRASGAMNAVLKELLKDKLIETVGKGKYSLRKGAK